MAGAVFTFISTKPISPGEKRWIPRIIVAIEPAILFTHSQYGRKKHFKDPIKWDGILLI